MDLNNFVLGYLYPFLYDIVHAFGGSDSDVDSAYNTLHDILTGDFGFVLVPIFFGPIALWNWAKDNIGKIDSAIQGGLSWLQDLLNQSINWVMQQVNAAVNWLNDAITNAVNWLTTQLSDAVTWLNDAITNAVNWLTTQLSDAVNWLTSQISNAVNWLTSQLSNLANWVGSQIQGAINWLNAQLSGVVNWLTTQLGDAVNWLQARISDLLTQLAPLFDFLAWWQNTGGDFITRFVADPVQTMLDLLAPKFVAWLEQLIADNW